jgi:hypothetical protein
MATADDPAILKDFFRNVYILTCTPKYYHWPTVLPIDQTVEYLQNWSTNWPKEGIGVWVVPLAQRLVLATGPGNPPGVRVWTAKTDRFGSRSGQKHHALTLCWPNMDTYPSTCGCRRGWLDPSGRSSGSAFRVSHLGSHSDMLLIIVKY